MTFKDNVRLLCTVVVALATAGCSSAKRDAEAAIRDSLKDPESARFGDFYQNKDTERGCFVVNAKNSMGGYTGDRVVRIEHDQQGWRYVEEGDEQTTMEDCRTDWADRK